MRLTVLREPLAVCQLPAEAAVPTWAWQGALASVSRTATELSIVCGEEAVPAQVRAERGWRCLQVKGPLDFALTGVLSSLLAPLAAEGVAVFALSTYETDFLLVRQGQLDAAVQAVRRAGHEVTDA